MGRLGIGTISWCGRERFGNQSFRFISFHPSTWRDALLSSRICRFWRAMLPHCRKTGGHGFCRAEKIFGRVGAKSEGTPLGVPKSFFFRSCRSTTLQLNPKTAANGDWRIANGERKTSTRNAQPSTQFYALRITLYAQLTTRNSQPDFGANAPPTCHFYALRFTHYAFPRPPSLAPRPVPLCDFRHG